MQSAIDHAEKYHDQVRSLYKYESAGRILRNKINYESIKDDFVFRNPHNNPTIKIFEQLSKVDEGEADKVASDLRSEFNQNHAKISNTIRIIIYLGLKMHFAKKVNNGNLDAASIVFELHKLMADNNYFFNNGQLSALGFINIVSLASFLKEHYWLSTFIEKYGPHLSLKTRNNTLSLAAAHLHYSRQEYDLSLERINQTYFKNINLKSMAGRLQLINYIDSDLEDTYFLKQKIENYRLLIYRNQRRLSKRVVKSCFNMSKILNLIVEKKDPSDIILKMNTMDSIFYRYYINTKLNKIAQE